MRRPDSSEHEPYYSTYVDQVPDGSVLDTLAEAPAALEAMLGDLLPDDETYTYAHGKWSIRAVLGHVIDTERLFGYRAAHIARGDIAELPGMDQDAWADRSNANVRPVTDLLTEFRGLRRANTAHFASLDDDVLSLSGVASGFEFTVRALVYIVAGHELHHRSVLTDRYLGPLKVAGSRGSRV